MEDRAPSWIRVCQPAVTGGCGVLGAQRLDRRRSSWPRSTVGRFTGGSRSNIGTDGAELEGTVRADSEGARSNIHDRIRAIAAHYAEAAGGTATVDIGRGTTYPVTINDPALTERMLPTLKRVAGTDNVRLGPPVRVAEDFSFFQQKVPGQIVPRVTKITRRCRRITHRSFSLTSRRCRWVPG
jgi:metal-dependent amidase/aminoacylase/carboxypeptidase family protein